MLVVETLAIISLMELLMPFLDQTNIIGITNLDISYNKFSRNVSSSFHNLNVGFVSAVSKQKPSIEVVISCFFFASNGTLEILIVYICNDGTLNDYSFNSGYSKTF